MTIKHSTPRVGDPLLEASCAASKTRHYQINFISLNDLIFIEIKVIPEGGLRNSKGFLQVKWYRILFALAQFREGE